MKGVVCPQPRAADVGAVILAKAGNSFDAAVDTAFSQMVNDPFMCTIGGMGMVLVGRATLYGTACGGQACAARAIKILSDEMDRSLGYVGARRVSEIGPHILAHRDPGMSPD